MKKVSRQYLWQEKKIKLGLCRICGKRKIFKSGLCGFHYKKTQLRFIEFKKDSDKYQKALLAAQNWRKNNRERGLCYCGKSLSPGKKSCPACLDRALKAYYKRKNYDKQIDLTK